MLHNCSLVFEMKTYITPPIVLCQPSVLANLDYNTHKAFIDCDANISNQYAVFLYFSLALFLIILSAFSIRKHVLIIILCYKSNKSLEDLL